MHSLSRSQPNLLIYRTDAQTQSFHILTAAEVALILCRGMAIGATSPVASVAAAQKVSPDPAVEGLEPAKLWAYFSKVGRESIRGFWAQWIDRLNNRDAASATSTHGYGSAYFSKVWLAEM
jgi:hypothetical protein